MKSSSVDDLKGRVTNLEHMHASLAEGQAGIHEGGWIVSTIAWTELKGALISSTPRPNKKCPRSVGHEGKLRETLPKQQSPKQKSSQPQMVPAASITC